METQSVRIQTESFNNQIVGFEWTLFTNSVSVLWTGVNERMDGWIIQWMNEWIHRSLSQISTACRAAKEGGAAFVWPQRESQGEAASFCAAAAAESLAFVPAALHIRSPVQPTHMLMPAHTHSAANRPNIFSSNSLSPTTSQTTRIFLHSSLYSLCCSDSDESDEHHLIHINIFKERRHIMLR